MLLWKTIITLFDLAESLIHIAADDGRDFLIKTEENKKHFERLDNDQLRNAIKHGHLNYSEKKAISEIFKERRNR